jgi:hypothetical protein
MPAPGSVTLASDLALREAGHLAACHSVRRVEIKETHLHFMPQLAKTFPNLTTLIIDSFIECDYNQPFAHPSLQTLHLNHLQGSANGTMWWLQGLPSLRELKLVGKIRDPFGDPPASRFIHQSLEALIIAKEPTLELLAHVTFPSLRFVAIDCHGSRVRVYPTTFSPPVLERYLLDLRCRSGENHLRLFFSRSSTLFHQILVFTWLYRLMLQVEVHVQSQLHPTGSKRSSALPMLEIWNG